MRTRTEADRRKRQAAKYARIVALTKILNAKENLSTSEARSVADALGVSERTIYRDIGVIREVRGMLAGYGTKINRPQDENEGTTNDET